MYAEDFALAFRARLRTWSAFSDSQVEVLTSLAVAQARFESADFSSHIFLQDNNCIGYNYFSGSIWQVGKGGNKPGSEGGGAYARYESIEDCARELADWIHRRRSVFQGVYDCASYAAALKQQGYYADSVTVYTQGLELYYQEPDVSGVSSNSPGFVSLVVGSLAGNFKQFWPLLLLGVAGLILSGSAVRIARKGRKVLG